MARTAIAAFSNFASTATLVPLGEYLNTIYRPDRDYIDGELRERNMGEQPHAHLQNVIGAIFRENRKQWKVRALTEQRVQTSANHYRIADVCIVRSSDPFDGIVRVPPLLCVEILSKGTLSPRRRSAWMITREWV